MAGYCAPAFAAAPVKGAVYHGFEGGPGGPVGVREHATTLRVALDGTGLSARRVARGWTFSCAAVPSGS